MNFVSSIERSWRSTFRNWYWWYRSMIQ